MPPNGSRTLAGLAVVTMPAMLRRFWGIAAVFLTPCALIVAAGALLLILSYKAPHARKIGSAGRVFLIDDTTYRRFYFTAYSMGRLYVGRVDIPWSDELPYLRDFSKSFLQNHAKGFYRGRHLGTFRSYGFGGMAIIRRNGLRVAIGSGQERHYEEVEGFRVLFFPIWYLLVLPAFILVWRYARSSAAWWRTTRRRRRNLCVHCGYDLRASPERCPECGTAKTEVAFAWPPVRWRLGLSMLACAGILVGLWFPAAAWWQQHEFLQAQTQCAQYTAPPDQLACFVYRRRQILAPDCWTRWLAAWGYRYDPRIFADKKKDQLLQLDDCIAPIFLHERKTPSGSSRIVAVGQPQFDSYSDPNENVAKWVLPYYCITPGTRWVAPVPGRWGTVEFAVSPERDLYFPYAPQLCFFAGQADPDDPTSFTLTYALNGMPGVIDCHLRDSNSDAIEYRLRPGSASTFPSR
jgi:hypothetical protein